MRRPSAEPAVGDEVLERAAERGAERVVEEYESVSVERRSMLPDPEELAGYQRHFPGLPTRIVGWTEDELEHRRSMERRELDARVRLASRGQFMAYSWTVFALVAAVLLALFDKNTGAIAALAAALVPALLGFIGAQRSGNDPAQEPGDEA